MKRFHAIEAHTAMYLRNCYSWILSKQKKPSDWEFDAISLYSRPHSRHRISLPPFGIRGRKSCFSFSSISSICSSISWSDRCASALSYFISAYPPIPPLHCILADEFGLRTDADDPRCTRINFPSQLDNLTCTYTLHQNHHLPEKASHQKLNTPHCTYMYSVLHQSQQSTRLATCNHPL